MNGALDGIKVLDLSRLAPGPFCTMMLGDLGADVLRIEEAGPPTGRRAEQSQGTAPRFQDIDRESPYYALNRNKRSLGLNLKAEEGRNIFYRLAKEADVIVEEFRPGVTKRLGIDYETISEMNPRIVYCGVTGYGQDGPYRDLVGHDINYISTAGALALIGEKGRKPAIPLNLVADYAGGGMYATIGVLAALQARERTGRGQYVDAAMTDGVVALMARWVAMLYANQKPIRRGETRNSGIYPFYNTYQCQDGKYLSIGCTEPWFWANLCRALGREDFIPRQNDEGEAKQEIIDFLTQTFATRPRDYWFEYLRAHSDIAVGKVYELEELEADPQLRHRELIVETDHPTLGKVKQVGVSVKLSDTPGSIRRFPPHLGEHTDEVLASLGYSREQISALRDKGVVK